MDEESFTDLSDWVAISEPYTSGSGETPFEGNELPGGVIEEGPYVGSGEVGGRYTSYATSLAQLIANDAAKFATALRSPAGATAGLRTTAAGAGATVTSWANQNKPIVYGVAALLALLAIASVVKGK